MSYTKSFFERLHFDATLKNGLIGRYFQNVRTIILITATLVIAGIATYISLKKELNPDIQIPTVIVSTVFPGAGPEDVEDLVTIPIEEQVSSLSDVTRVTSNSQENFSTVVIEFASTVDPDKAKTDTQNAVDQVANLPEESNEPSVEIVDFRNQPVLLMALTAPGNESALPTLADELEDSIKALPSVERVTQNYRRDPEIAITLSPEALQSFGLNIGSLSGTLNAALSSFPAGTLASERNTIALDQVKTVDSIDELRSLPVNVDGETLPLSAIASVEESEDPSASPALYIDHEHAPTRAIFMSVYETENADTRTTIEEVKGVIERFRMASPVAFESAFYFDGAEEIDRSFSQLQKDFTITFLLVFAVLLLFFGVRQSVIAALAIPFTFLVTFIVMGMVGISINFISLFSLLLALGILVDNAIVVISALSSYYRSGKFTPLETALLVFRDFSGVIMTTTITTVWAFVPLLLSTGIIGEFIRPIPIVVSSALAISAVTALFLVIPYMAVFLEGHFPRRVKIALQVALFIFFGFTMYFLMPEGKSKVILFLLALILLFLVFRLARSFFATVTLWRTTKAGTFWENFREHGFISFDRLSLWYSQMIERILSSRRARRLTMVFLIIFMVFSYALVPMGYVVNEFFPNDDINIVYVSAEMPIGTTQERALSAVRELMPRFQKLPELGFALAEIGAGAPTDSAMSVTGKDFGSILFTVRLIDREERERTSTEITALLNREFADWNGGTVTATQLSGGPPAGADLQLKLLGADLTSLQALAEKTRAHLETVEGVNNVTLSLSSAGKKLSFDGNDAALARSGIAPFDTAMLLQTLGNGFTVKEDVRFGEDERDVIIRFGKDSFNSPEDIGRLLVRTDTDIVPLLSLGSLTLEQNPTLITREDEERTISISAGVEEGYSVTELNRALEEYAENELGLPEGYSWKTGGVNEENNRSVQSILYAMILSAILIFATMAIQFNSYRKALIVLMVIPIAVSGVFVLFALFGIPLSFPALIGVLALFGIVVNNSIIMVDKINKNLDLGLPVREAVVEGATSRLEPILLTALTTIVGLIPITLSDPIWMGLGGAIIAGLSFSGIAKLFFIPVIYEMWFDPEGKASEQSSTQPKLV